MPEHPTPAPALTDEQIEGGLTVAKWAYGKLAGYSTPPFSDLLDAVIARAKREERERIADELAAWLDAEHAPPIWYEAVDIADPTWCDRHPEEATDDH